MSERKPVTEAQVLDVMARLREDGQGALCQDALQCLEYFHGVVRPPAAAGGPTRVFLVEGRPDPRLERALLSASPLRAVEELLSAEDEEEPRLEPPFHVDAEDSFETLADAAQEAEHRHAETGKAVKVYDKGEREAYVSKGPPPEEG